jgi:bifunctional aspartokinase / homoserine dehydrogenase 1
MDQWVVHKFGGSSVADAGCFRKVAAIVEACPRTRQAVVLSACRGVTDALLNLIGLASAESGDFAGALGAVKARHADIAADLLDALARNAYLTLLDKDCQDLLGLLQTVRLIRAAPDTVRDVVSGYGEMWSTRLFSAFLRQRGRITGEVRWLDARKVVVVDWGPLGPAVDWGASEANIRGAVSVDFKGCLIVTGFIASTPKGVQTTLGRNGSDFSGSIFGALLHAAEIHIWTDVDGVLSADPRIVPNAQVIDQLSYNEAMELAYFGAKVIHPQTMAPAVVRDIPIYIRNTFAPDRPNTLICAKPASQLVVKGITSIDQVALFNLEGAGMIGVPGTAHRLFGALRDAGISVILISQGSSEHSICFAIPAAQADAAERAVRAAFDAELRGGQIQSVEVDRSSSILAVVGDGMAGAHGVAAKVFETLGDAGVNVRAIAQGASERNISVVVDGKVAAKAVRAVHAGFYLSPHTVSIGLIGPGIVGSALLQQIASQIDRLRRDFNLDLRLRGILSSKRMLVAENAIDLRSWQSQFGAGSEAADLDKFADHMQVDYIPHTVLIDCTASSAIADRYEAWLSRGIHIVTPNKKANSGTFAYYRALQAARRAAGTQFLYEATVGAGLPVIQTLRDLRETGDEITAIEGIFSGTLAYLFNVFDGTESFSSIVKTAKAKGYTEPDPRDDLSGMDVARKLIILGREMGLELEMHDVQVESLVPAELDQCNSEEFLRRLPEFDSRMNDLYRKAKEGGQVLRYVGRLEASGRATVGLTRLPAAHSFAHMALTDNIVRFATGRYCDNPLIVQGPGAGPAVTAGGVFSDLLRLSGYLGANI